MGGPREANESRKRMRKEIRSNRKGNRANSASRGPIAESVAKRGAGVRKEIKLALHGKPMRDRAAIM